MSALYVSHVDSFGKDIMYLIPPMVLQTDSMSFRLYLVCSKSYKGSWMYTMTHGTPTVTLTTVIHLPAGTSIVHPVGYMDQPTGLLHVYLWRRLCGRQGRRLFR